jgi:hypothetical protein
MMMVKSRLTSITTTTTITIPHQLEGLYDDGEEQVDKHYGVRHDEHEEKHRHEGVRFLHLLEVELSCTCNICRIKNIEIYQLLNKLNSNKVKI